MEQKIFSMEWNKIACMYSNMEKSSSIPYHTLLIGQVQNTCKACKFGLNVLIDLPRFREDFNPDWNTVYYLLSSHRATIAHCIWFFILIKGVTIQYLLAGHTKVFLAGPRSRYLIQKSIQHNRS